MSKLKPKDLIAIVIIMGVIVLKFYNIDSGLNGALGLMVGFYFGARTDGRDTGH